MSLKKSQHVSAQVLLRPASGKAIDGNTVITAETIQDFAPSPETVTRAREAFTRAGFEVGAIVGGSFPITAPVRVFESMFKTRLHQAKRGGIKAVHADGSESYELPLNTLPPSMAQLVEAVTFTPPPDFGPAEFSAV